MRTRHGLRAAIAGTLGLGIIAVPAIATPAAFAVPVLPDLVINEVIQDNDAIADAVELLNLGDTTIDLSGWKLQDDKNELTIDAGTSIEPGEFVAITVDDDARDDKFGLGKADEAKVLTPAGDLVDEFSWSGHQPTSYGRCPDGTGDFIVTVSATPNAANDCIPSPHGNLVINEAVMAADSWVELHNAALQPMPLGGLSLEVDGEGGIDVTALPDIVIAPGGFHVLHEADFGFDLGATGEVTVADGDDEAVDSFAWTEAAATSFGRNPALGGDFAETLAATPGAANEFPVVETPNVVVNEVESSDGNPGDWIELFNLEDEEVDLSGWVVRDNDDAHVSTLPSGSTIPAGGFFVVEESQLGYGLGKEDSARIYLPGGVTLVDQYDWTATADDEHAPTTFGRCPDGTGDWKITTAVTKGAPNDCGIAVRINEIESNGDDVGDWVELVNVGFEPVDLGGWTLTDSGASNDPVVFEAGTILDAGAYLQVYVYETFGLGGGDSITLATADADVIDFHAWTSHAGATLGRCPDGTGPFANTRDATPGAKNACADDLITVAWPGSDRMDTADVADTFGADMSGAAFDADAGLWAVNNGNGTLHKLDFEAGSITEADGWENGRVLRYPDGTGTVDAEGVDVIAGDAANGVLVASERNTGPGDRGSRPSVLRYAISGSSELVATHEWNLSAEYPGIGANAGLEGVAWVSDDALVDAGLIDQTTGEGYDPSIHPAHSGGVVFVGVEATGTVAGYVLGDGGEIVRITEFDTAFPGVMELEYDDATGRLWALCDDACEGLTEVFSVADAGDEAGTFASLAVQERPSGSPNIANEGLAIAPIELCADGLRPVVWTDDSETDGHAFRVGAIDCEGGGDGGSGDGGDGGDAGGGDGGGDSSGSGDGAGVGEHPAPPAAPLESDLTDGLENLIDAPSVLERGAEFTVTLPDGLQGTEVNGWLFSTPLHLGTRAVNDAGQIMLTVPLDAPLGAHRLAVTAADGTVIGWQIVQLVVDGAGSGSADLASTGAEHGPMVFAAGAALFALIGAAVVIAARRRAL